MLLAHQCGKGRGIEGTAAQQTMVIEKPCGADLADRRTGRQFRQDVGRVVVGFRHSVERRDPQINLAHLKAGDLDVEIKVKQGEALELLGEQPVVPDGDLGQPVVGDHKGAGLRRGEMIETQGRHLGPAELSTGEEPAVTRDDVEIGIDQHRHIEAESLDAVGDLPDLLLAVAARVGGVRFQLVYPVINNC